MRIAEIWRYPVKSMLGEALPASAVTSDGLVGDRAWGLLNAATGKFLTARREPRLLFARARLDGDDVVIMLPDGTETNDDDALSAWLGFDVSLVKADQEKTGTFEIQLDFETEVGEWHEWRGPTGSFHDSGKRKISLVSQASFGEWDGRRFRINVVLAEMGAREEDALVGQRVRLGNDLAVNVTVQIDRCIITTRPQADGIERDLDVLRTINRDHATFLGVGGLIEAEGSIAIGDEVRIA